MDLYLVQMDGLDVAITDSEREARAHARRLAIEEPLVVVQVLQIRDGSLEVIPRIPAAEAVAEEAGL